MLTAHEIDMMRKKAKTFESRLWGFMHSDGTTSY